MMTAAVALAVTMLAFEPLPVGIWVDDGHYVMLARALATGHGYRYMNLPGEPYGTHFPPGYPALLAVLTRLFPVFPHNVRVFTLVNALLTAATAAGIVVLGYRRLSLTLPVAALTATIWAVAVPTLMLSTAVMSEPLFLALLIPTLLLAERAARDGGLRATAGTCVMLALCTLVRSIGVSGFAAFGLVLMARRRWRELGVAVVTGAAGLAPWIIWKRLHRTHLPVAWAGMYGDYDHWLTDGLTSHGVRLVWKVVLQNARDVVEAFAVYWSEGPEGTFRNVIAVLLLVSLVAGVAACWRRVPVVVWTLLTYIAIVLLWPFHPQRFVWGAGPLWVPLATAGVLRSWQRMRTAITSRPSRALASAVLAVVVLCIPVGSLLAVRTRAWNRVPRSGVASALPMIRWIVKNTPPDAVLASDAETVIYLYTGRRGLPYVPFKAADRVGLMTPSEAYAGLAEVLRLYHPRWVYALGAGPLKVAGHFTTHDGAPLRVLAVLAYGAVFETRGLPTQPAVPSTHEPAGR
jgi:hypothetical protein